MSETEHLARIGRLVIEHPKAKRRVQELGERLGAFSARLSELSGGLRVSPDGSMSGESWVYSTLHEFPGEFCADFLRDLIADYKQARGKLLDIRSQLEGYGIE